MTDNREIRISGNGQIQRCPYDPKMNDVSWRPTIWHRHEEGEVMTDNRTTELLPCPFCGGEADEYEGDYGNGIYCMMCGAMVGELIHLEYMTTKRVSIDEAIATWNARAERGTLTAEQVMGAFENHANMSFPRFVPDWQAIADELNARAERTCEPTEEDCCSYCGEDIIKCNVAIGAGGGAVELDPPMYHNYCPHCGARVKASKQ